jgi:hypothetical protein
MAATMKLSLERNIQLGFAVALATVIAAGFTLPAIREA